MRSLLTNIDHALGKCGRSYSRRHLATPQGSYGPIQPDQLAAATGRTLTALLHALPDLAERPRPQRRHTRQRADDKKTRNQTRKQARSYGAVRAYVTKQRAD
jgi:hypothetical protein